MKSMRQRNITRSNCYLCYMFSSIVTLCDVDDFFTVSYIKCHVVNKQGIFCWNKTGQSGVVIYVCPLLQKQLILHILADFSHIIYSCTVSIAYWIQQYMYYYQMKSQSNSSKYDH